MTEDLTGQPSRPGFVLDHRYTTPEESAAIEEIRAMARTDLDFARDTLSTYLEASSVVEFILRNPQEGIAATENVMKFLRDHPEGGLAKLALWHTVIEDVDSSYNVDAETKADLETDPEYMHMQAEYTRVKHAGGDATLLQREIRRRRLDTLLRHMSMSAA